MWTYFENTWKSIISNLSYTDKFIPGWIFFKNIYFLHKCSYDKNVINFVLIYNECHYGIKFSKIYNLHYDNLFKFFYISNLYYIYFISNGLIKSQMYYHFFYAYYVYTCYYIRLIIGQCACTNTVIWRKKNKRVLRCCVTCTTELTNAL